MVCAGCARAPTAPPPITRPGSALHGPSAAGAPAPSGARTRTASAPARNVATAAPGRETARLPAIDDDATLGANAHLYLNRVVPRLVVEILAVRGYGPAQSALDTLRARLGSVADKPGGIVFASTTIASGRDTWSSDDLEAAVKRYSRYHSSASEMVEHILYVNGTFKDSSGVIGVAFSSSSAALFKEEVEAAATPLVTPDEIEQADVVHETGHILSLVNIGYHSPRDHEDPQHPHHSSDRHSVMYWATDRVDVVGLLGGSTGPSTQFDADDRADLMDIRDGRLP
jgi:hypothetical protein